MPNVLIHFLTLITAVQTVTISSQDICEEINRYRLARGITPPYGHSVSLQAVAEQHLANLRAANYDFTDTSATCNPHSWWADPTQEVTPCCYPKDYTCIGHAGRLRTATWPTPYPGNTNENIAFQSRFGGFFAPHVSDSGMTAASVVANWANSPGHARTMSAAYLVCGAAHVEWQEGSHYLGAVSAYFGDALDPNQIKPTRSPLPPSLNPFPTPLPSRPTVFPTGFPTRPPSALPSTILPSTTRMPTPPTSIPTGIPTGIPTAIPTAIPLTTPTTSPIIDCYSLNSVVISSIGSFISGVILTVLVIGTVWHCHAPVPPIPEKPIERNLSIPTTDNDIFMAIAEGRYDHRALPRQYRGKLIPPSIRTRSPPLAPPVRPVSPIAGITPLQW